jgi:hypothetical protein
VPALDANLGNLQTSGAAGLWLRMGQGLAMDFGPPRVRPALSGAGVFRQPGELVWYLSAGVEGRAVAYDETLDGNRSGYSPRRPPPLPAELTTASRWREPVRLDGSVVFQSATFDEQTRTPHV